MKTLLRLLALTSLLGAAISRAADALVPPADARIAVVRDTLHGVVVEDPYRWLEDKESAETRARGLRDANGRIVGAGLYFARLDAGGRSLVRRIAVTP